jgi:hypothetical protein
VCMREVWREGSQYFKGRGSRAEGELKIHDLSKISTVRGYFKLITPPAAAKNRSTTQLRSFSSMTA